MLLRRSRAGAATTIAASVGATAMSVDVRQASACTTVVVSGRVAVDASPQLFNWTVAFLGRGRAQRVISAHQVFARQALEVHARDAANEPALSTAGHAEGATP